MKVTVKNRNGVTVLTPHGRLKLPHEVAVRHAVQEALDAGARDILLNLGGVPVIDSAGVGELVRTYTSTVNRSGRMRLCSLRPHVLDIIQLTLLHQVFEIFEHEEGGIDSFRSHPARRAASG